MPGLGGQFVQFPTRAATIHPFHGSGNARGSQVIPTTLAQSPGQVVVDPKDNTNREGLQSIGKRLCQSTIRCKVWFWDDISKADTAYPVDPDKEELLIAVYSSDLSAQTSELKVFTLGDER